MFLSPLNRWAFFCLVALLSVYVILQSMLTEIESLVVKSVLPTSTQRKLNNKRSDQRKRDRRELFGITLALFFVTTGLLLLTLNTTGVSG